MWRCRAGVRGSLCSKSTVMLCHDVCGSLGLLIVFYHRSLAMCPLGFDVGSGLGCGFPTPLATAACQAAVACTHHGLPQLPTCLVRSVITTLHSRHRRLLTIPPSAHALCISTPNHTGLYFRGRIRKTSFGLQKHAHKQALVSTSSPVGIYVLMSSTPCHMTFAVT